MRHTCYRTTLVLLLATACHADYDDSIESDESELRARPAAEVELCSPQDRDQCLEDCFDDEKERQMECADDTISDCLSSSEQEAHDDCLETRPCEGSNEEELCNKANCLIQVDSECYDEYIDCLTGDTSYDECVQDCPSECECGCPSCC